MLVKVYSLLNFVLRTQGFFSQYREPAWLSRSLVNILTSTCPIHIQLVNQVRSSLTLQKSERGSSRCYGLTGCGCLVYLTLHCPTIPLLHSTSLYLTRSITTLLHSTLLYYRHGFTSLYITLLHSKLLYAWVYFTLLHSTLLNLPRLYFSLLHSTFLYHDSTSLYLILPWL